MISIHTHNNSNTHVVFPSFRLRITVLPESIVTTALSFASLCCSHTMNAETKGNYFRSFIRRRRKRREAAPKSPLAILIIDGEGSSTITVDRIDLAPGKKNGIPGETRQIMRRQASAIAREAELPKNSFLPIPSIFTGNS